MDGPNERVCALESSFAKIRLGEWSSNQEVPWWTAIRITPQAALKLKLVSAVQLAAQAKTLQGSQAEGVNRLLSAVVDDWCLTRPHPFARHPHWGVVVEQLAMLADRYPSGSPLSEAAFDLARRVVNRAQEAHKQVSSA